MNRKNRSGLFISTILALTVFAGCNTVKPEPVVYEPIVLKTSDLTISLEYLDEATIEVRHGRNDARLYKNPYYGFPFSYHPQEFLRLQYGGLHKRVDREFPSG